MRIESPRPAEPDVDEREVDEPEAAESERDEQDPEHGERVGYEGYESATAEPETGIHERGAEEPGIDERVVDEPDDDDFAAAAPAADEDEPVPYTPVTAEPVPTAPAPAAATAPPEFGSPFIAADESVRFHEQIHQIQGTFVDDPRQSVRDAEHLLEDIVRSLAAGLEERRRALTTLSSEDGSGTEELRQALRSYRSLATQLLGPEN